MGRLAPAFVATGLAALQLGCFLTTAIADTTPFVSLNGSAAAAMLDIANASVARGGSAAALQHYQLKVGSSSAGTRVDLLTSADMSVVSTRVAKGFVVKDRSEAAVTAISGNQLEALYLASLAAKRLGQTTFDNVLQVSIDSPVPDHAEYLLVGYALNKPAVERVGNTTVFHCDTELRFVIDLATQTTRPAARIC